MKGLGQFDWYLFFGLRFLFVLLFHVILAKYLRYFCYRHLHMCIHTQVVPFVVLCSGTRLFTGGITSAKFAEIFL